MPRFAAPRLLPLITAALAVLLVLPPVLAQPTASAEPADPVRPEVVAGPSSAVAGQLTMLTATVHPADAAGTVRFLVGDEPVGAAEVVGGVATHPYIFSTVGVIPLSVVFDPADPSAFTSSTGSGDVQVTAPGPVSTPTSVTVATAAAVVGAPVDLTATVSPAIAGTVQFFADGNPIGAQVPVVGGTATLSHAFTAAGPVRLSATFVPADPAYAASQSANVTLEVTRRSTAVRVTGPEGAEVDEPTILTAQVAPADVAGTVTFTVDGTMAGSVEVAAGTASLAHTFAAAGVSTVRATFVPADPADDAAADDTGLDVVVGQPVTSVEVTGPQSATAGTPTALTAAVTPADVPGTVTFSVAGESSTVDVESGTATTPHTFATDGEASVVATFEPAAGSGHRGSVSPAYEVTVAPGPSSSTSEEPISEPEIEWEVPRPSFCTPGAARFGGTPVQSFVTFYVLPVDQIIYNPFFFAPPSFQLSWQYEACRPFGSGRARAETVSGRVQCVPVESGYTCPLALPARFESLTVSSSVPMPAAFAGRRVDVEPSMTLVDPETGATTVYERGPVSVKVPRRTALTAEVAPVKRGVTSVRRGGAVAYRVAVRNAGVLAATRVRGCVLVGQGVEIRKAAGAEVRGQRVCWTLPTVARGRTVARTLTLVAPRRKGDLTLRTVVTPRKTQADVVRLVTALPIR